MPYVATYSADFTKWNAALRDASAGLKSFEVTGKGVQRQLENMAKSFSGVEIKKQADVAAAAVRAIGGASKLTETEQRRVNATIEEAIAKYRAMGQEVPEHLRKVQRELQQVEKSTSVIGTTVGRVGALLAGAFTIGALTNLARQVLDFAGTLTDLSAKTGIGTAALQEFKFAGGQVGVSLEAITSAVGKLQNNIGEGNKSAVGALKQLGLSLEQVKALKPEDQFRLIADRLNDVKDQTEFVQIGMDLMGKGFMEVAPLIRGDLQALTEDARRLGVVITDETIQALDDMGDRLDALKAVGLANFARALVTLEQPLTLLLQGIGGAADALKFLQDGFTRLVGGAILLRGEMYRLQAAVMDYNRSINPIIALTGSLDEAIDQARQSAADAAREYRFMFEDIRREAILAAIAASKLQEIRGVSEAARQSTESFAQELAKARAEMSALSREQRVNVRAGLELGQSHEDIAKAVGTSAAAVRLYDTALKQAEQSQKKTGTEAKKLAADVAAGTREIAKFQREITEANRRVFEEQADKSMKALADAFIAQRKLQEDADRELRRLTLSKTEFQIDEIRRWYEQERYFIGLSGEAWKGQLSEVEQTAADKIGAVIMQTDEWRLAMIQLGTVFPPLLAYLDQLKDKADKAGNAGKRAGDYFAESFKQALTSIPDIIIEGILNGASAEETAVAVGTQLGGALGESIGLALSGGNQLAGSLGKALGSLIGPLIDAIVKTRAEKTVERVAYEFGVGISEELARGIEDQAKREFGGNRQAAKIFNLDQIISEGGGLSSQNYQQLFARFRDLFSMVETGAFTAAQGIEVLDNNFRTFADFVTKGGSLASKELLDIIRLTEQFGMKSAEVSAFVVQETNRALGGLTTFVQNAKVTTQAAADGISAALFGIFEAQTKNGIPAADIIRQLDPLIDQLDAQFKAAGLSGGAAFDEIRALAAVASDEIAGPLITGVLGLEQAFSGLYNSGILTEDMFDGLTAAAMDSWQQILATGVDGSKALQLIAPTLQTIWELTEDFGYSVDEATQALLEEAEAAGVVGEQHRTAQEQMLRLTERMTDAIEYMARQWGYVTDQVEEFGDALNNLPDDVTVKGEVEWAARGIPEDFDPGSAPRIEEPVPGFTHGTVGPNGQLGFYNFGRGQRIEAHGREMIVPYEKREEAADILGGNRAGPSYVIQSGAVVVYSYDPDRAGDLVVEGLNRLLDARSAGAVSLVGKIDAVRKVRR